MYSDSALIHVHIYTNYYYVHARVKLIKNKIFYKIHGSFIATMFFMINMYSLAIVYNKLRLLDK